MTTMSTSEAVMVEAVAGVATANTSSLPTAEIEISVREITGSGTVSLTAITFAGDTAEVIYESDGTTAATIALGTPKTVTVRGRIRQVIGTSDNAGDAFTLAVVRL